MPLTKKVLISIVSVIFLISSFSGCVFDELLGGTSFTLNSWNVCDDEGFAGLSFNFTCSGTVNVKLLSPSSLLLDSDFFFKGNYDTIFNLAEFRHSVTPGQYSLKAYNNDNKEIFSQVYSFEGADLTILSCDQKWWKRDPWVGGYSLIGLEMYVQNDGDTPAYPYKVIASMDSIDNSSLALPCVILPGDSGYVDCFIYRNTAPEDSTFVVSLEDTDQNTLVTDSFSVVVEDNVPIKQYSWQYGGNRRPNIPKPEYLYNYYSNLDRSDSEDYGLYVFDLYDDQYIDIVVDSIMFGFSSGSDVDKINYVASFVQNLEYKSDSDTNSSYEYPRYPVETMFNGEGGGGDCEDKAILTASLLQNLGYDIALLRLPEHMAVGVHLSEGAIPNYDYYTDNYYFLETTTAGKSCGFVPIEYDDLREEVTVYPITLRPLLLHKWEDNSLTIFTNTDMGDIVKVSVIVQNLGIETAENIKVVGGFYRISGLKDTSKNYMIDSLDPSMKKEIIISLEIPKTAETWFKTKIFLDNEVVDEKESISSFPTT
jgi:predicted transglutaminase-like cysteine proteinase